MSREIATLSLLELSDAFATSELSPVDATRAALDQIAAHNDTVNAIAYLAEQEAMTHAKEAEQRWQKGHQFSPFDGVPCTVKDSVFVEGWPTRYGSQLEDPNNLAPEDAPVTARLREAGMVVIAKTTMPEYGWKGTTDNKIQGITPNPWDLEKSAGGSSGGGAVATALGMGAFAIGTDGGGSIRIPASFCGLFGLKPTSSVVASYPPSGFGTLAHTGPITRSVTDAALVMNIIAQPDHRDFNELPCVNKDYFEHVDTALGASKIAFSPALGKYAVESEVADLVAKAVEAFADIGAELSKTDPDVEGFHDAFDIHWQVACRANYADLPEDKKALMDPGLVALSEHARHVDLVSYFQAEQTRREITVKLNRFFTEYDLLVTPTLPVTAFPAAQDSPSPNSDGTIDSWTPFTCLFNFTGHPAATVPCGFTTSGLPVGLQIISGHYRDDLVLRAARVIENMYPIVLPTL
tara:strand:- start:469 stop:1863 length:1395 start_codon:yes stop_codon:yes gene_type:complete